jgi:cytoskeletal protein CcmA (bactofilin family)
MKNKEAITLLGENSTWEGTLSFPGTLRIDGHFKGTISSCGILLIGEEGLVEANIHAGYIEVNGEVRGDITADQRVDLHKQAKVFGNIKAPNVVMDQGAILEGTTRMYQATSTAPKDPSIVEFDNYNSGPPPNLTAIHGIITNNATNSPVKNATVICKGKEKRTANTNASGYYEFINLDNNKWKLKIKANGYKGNKAIVEITDGGTHEQNFSLRPKK